MCSSQAFDAWVDTAPLSLRQDPLWRMKAYRLAVFMSELAAADARVLASHPTFAGIADQLARAAGSVGANIAEGYSRGSGRDRVRLFEYALGSARETAHWYHMARAELSASIDLASRIDSLNQIKRLLLAAIPAERHRQITRREGER